MPSRDYYEQRWETMPEGLAPERFTMRSRFLLAHVAPGQRVLDVGCGEGRFAAELERAGAEVVALDVAEEALRRARAFLPGLDARLIASDASWPSPDADFDVVWAGEVIEHVADTAAWLSELRRVLRPGGLVLLTTPAHERLALLRLALSARAFAEHMDPLGEHLRFYSRATLTRLLCEFRFERAQVRASRGVLLASAVRSRF